MIYLIAAMSENRVIGRCGRLPWNFPEDRRKFRELTMGHPVLMGRRTFEEIGGALPGRRTIVVTRDPDYRASGCVLYRDLTEAIRAESRPGVELFVAGGGEIFEEALPFADRIYLTIIHRSWEGDTFFPVIPPGHFVKITEEPIKGVLPATLVVLQRPDAPPEEC